MVVAKATAGEGYTVEASGFADDLVRFHGFVPHLGPSLTKAEAEATAKDLARELMAGRREGGRVIVRHDKVVVRDLTFRAGKWVAS